MFFIFIYFEKIYKVGKQFHGHLSVYFAALKWNLIVLWKVNYVKWCFLVYTGCLAKANTWKTVFLKQMQVKGCLDTVDTGKQPWWRSINMTPQTVGDEHWELVCFVPSQYSSLCIDLSYIAFIVELNLWSCHHWEKLTQELLMRFLQ